MNSLSHPPAFESTNVCDELTRLSSASLLIEAAMSARSPFADNASKSSRRADKSKKSVIGRGPKREAVERRIEEELSRSSGRRRAAEDKEEEERRGTTEHWRKRKRVRKQGERVDDDGMEKSGEEAGREERPREGGRRSHEAVVETKVEVVVDG